MKKINHPYLVQKDLHEFWSSDWGWLHIGDLVRVPVVAGRPVGGTAMVIGFFYDPRHNPGHTDVAVHPARDPSAVWFIPVGQCSPAGAQ